MMTPRDLLSPGKVAQVSSEAAMSLDYLYELEGEKSPLALDSSLQDRPNCFDGTVTWALQPNPPSP